jgi:hypothetical protein
MFFKLPEIKTLTGLLISFENIKGPFRPSDRCWSQIRCGPVINWSFKMHQQGLAMNQKV